MWTQWHIKYSDLNDLYTLYPNLAGDLTLCSNWMEPGNNTRNTLIPALGMHTRTYAGLHFDGNEPSRQPDKPRAMSWTADMDHFPDELWKLDWGANKVGVARVR